MENFWDGLAQGAQDLWSNVSSNTSVGDVVDWVGNEYDKYVAPVTPWDESTGGDVLTWASGEYNRLPESPVKTWATDQYNQYVVPNTPWDEGTGENAITWATDQYNKSDLKNYKFGDGFKNSPIGGMFRHIRKSVNNDPRISEKIRKTVVY